MNHPNLIRCFFIVTAFFLNSLQFGHTMGFSTRKSHEFLECAFMLLFLVNVTAHPLSAKMQGIFWVGSGSDSDSDDDILAKISVWRFWFWNLSFKQERSDDDESSIYDKVRNEINHDGLNFHESNEFWTWTFLKLRTQTGKSGRTDKRTDERADGQVFKRRV